MSKAKITRALGYLCAPEGHTIVVFPFGAIVEGDVAEWALADHAAVRLFDTKVDGPTETKRRRK